MRAVESPRIVLHADKEHAGLRLVALLSLFAAYVIGFFLLGWLIDTLAPPRLAEYGTFLACVGGLPLALLVTWALESALKNVWHSGLRLELDQAGIEVNDTRRQTQLHRLVPAPRLAWSEDTRVTNWYFGLAGYPRGGRERRIDKHWLCLATELLQNETRLIVYSFVPPAEANQLAAIAPGGMAFRELSPSEVYDSSLRSRFVPPTRPTIPADVLHGPDGRYWLAERRRWERGIELAPEDYRIFLHHIFSHLPTSGRKADDNPLEDSE